MRHYSAADVDRLLPMEGAIEAARATAMAVAAGQVHQAPRIWHTPAGMPGQMGVMPSYLPADGRAPALFVTKIVGVFPDAQPSVNGVIAVSDGHTGAPIATIDAAAITARRTAAASGLSIDLLARQEARTIALIGTGTQGWAHLQAARAVRTITRVRVWNRSSESAADFAARAATLKGIGQVEICETPGQAATTADIVSLCTNSATALLKAQDVAPGTHVTAIGAFTATTREMAADLIAASDHVVVDDRDAAGHEAGDILLAIAAGAVPADVISADLAELVSGTQSIERRPKDLTIYKSVGTSAMDAVAVRALLSRDPDLFGDRGLG